ncbi:MAG: hypothetical protein LUC41_08825 [Clostridiales bacterium]|nr:hypothetical protein [Clostridiales bacterium]
MRIRTSTSNILNRNPSRISTGHISDTAATNTSKDHTIRNGLDAVMFKRYRNSISMAALMIV